MITLPRSIDIKEIYKNNKLSYMTVRIESYRRDCATQCYSCNSFDHNSANYHLNPRCMKWKIPQDYHIIDRIHNPFGIHCKELGEFIVLPQMPFLPETTKALSKG
ncbi:hypothetical protein NPIL_189361 [Nephila pilipes]|uniref:Uncharacterized protein n=1 Tax=Nephila pilipes TaxID=299642 RepID=A0A8X6MWN3_NEPPI|nr:hypothetical protein NPIL_189361 [Nephila pilipes]